MNADETRRSLSRKRSRSTGVPLLVAAFFLGVCWVTDTEALKQTKKDKGADHENAHATSTGAGVDVGVIEGPPIGISPPVGISMLKFHAAGRLSGGAASDFRGLTPGMCTPPPATGAAEHGTLVSDVVGSDHYIYTGVANASTLHVGWMSGFNALRTAIGCFGGVPVDLFNNSWGNSPGSNDDGGNNYARFMDWYARAKDAVIVKSAGNEGAGDAQISLPGDAFNVITVGAVGANLVDRVDYSSYLLSSDVAGQADGRGKPEIVAPGGEGPIPADLIENDSLLSPLERIADSGTSFATPHVTGTSALLVEAGLPLGNMPDLRNHLAHKAIILNSTRKRFINSPMNEIPMARDNPGTGGQASDCDYLTRSGRLQPRSGSACPAAAGTTREWTPSNWRYDGGLFLTTRPLDDELGTGVLDAERALIQHAGGQQDMGGYLALVGPIGWNLQCKRGGFPDDVYKTRFTVGEGDFITATLVWDRRIDEVEVVPGEVPDGVVEIGDTYRPHAADLGALPDFDLKLYEEGPAGSILVASSNSGSEGASAQNVEHLHVPAPGTAVYEIHVEADPGAGGPCLDYGLAWWIEPRGEFGDAPKSYGTLLLDNGPRHMVPGYESLGPTAPSAESDANDPQDPDLLPNLIVGRHGAWLNRSDAADLDKYDDGVKFYPTTYRAGQAGTMDITVCAYVAPPRYQCGADCALFVNAWIDWNTNGIFEEGAEHVVNPLVHIPQTTSTCQTFSQSFPVPSINTGDLWARIRLDYGEDVGRNDPLPLFTSSPTLSLAKGEARFGEVEDYFLGSDFGDLSDHNITPPCLHAHPRGSTQNCGITLTTWKTDLSNDGARHLDFGLEGIGDRASREPDADEAPNDQDGAPNLDPCVIADEPPFGPHLAQCGGADGFDDGVDFIVLQVATGFIQYKFRARVSSTVASQGFGGLGRYDATDPAKRLYLNGWMDLANTGAHEPDGAFDRQVFDLAIDPETFGPDMRYTLGETFVDDGLDRVAGTGDLGEGNGRFDWTDQNGNGAHDNGEPSEVFNDTAGLETKTFESAVFTDAYPEADNFVLFSAQRFRLDYGQDIAQPFGPASFGEVEDYHNPEGGGVPADADGDGVPNAEDNCASVPNPPNRRCSTSGTPCTVNANCPPLQTCILSQEDNDGDGSGDPCDTDDDNDGIPDGSDLCSLVSNPGQEDLDDDGQGDACDADRDGDGMPDSNDNCPDVPNPRLCSASGTPCQVNADCPPGTCLPQEDSDGNGIGDACEPDLQGCCGVGGSGNCAMRGPVACVNAGGTPLGSGSSCLASEACCSSSGSCQDLEPQCCALFGLQPLGPGSECPPSGTCSCGAVPSDPSNLRVSKEGSDVVLSWDSAPIIDQVESWNVYRDDAPNTALWGPPHINADIDVGPTTRDYGAVTESSPIRFYKITATNACGESPLP